MTTTTTTALPARVTAVCPDWCAADTDCTAIGHHLRDVARMPAVSGDMPRQAAHVDVVIVQDLTEDGPVIALWGRDGADGYTPAQARALAEQLLAAADACEV